MRTLAGSGNFDAARDKEYKEKDFQSACISCVADHIREVKL